MNNDQAAHNEPDPLTSLKEAKNRGLGWRAVIGLVALVIVAILAYPFILEQLNAKPDNLEQVSPESQATVTTPQVTLPANPESAQAQFELGNAYVQAGQWDQAVAAFQKAIELEPDFQGAYANLGVVYYQLEKLDLAASQYKKALELDPTDGDVAYNLGALYLQQALLNGTPPNSDLLHQAVTQLKHASELDPNLAEPYFSLGVAYNAMGQKEEAIQAFEMFLARDSGQDPRAGQEAQRYLEALRN